MSAVAEQDRIRSVAIVAHVDHGKTTLADALLKAVGELPAVPSEGGEPSKQVTVMPKVASLTHAATLVHLVDAPSHPDFGGEIERTLRMVDGLVWVVDAVEGPAPPTRPVLRRALAAGLRPIVVINKIDRPHARVEEVVGEVRETLADLDASGRSVDAEILFTDALRGRCRLAADGPDGSLEPLLDRIADLPSGIDPRADEPMLFRVTHMDYDDLLGRIALGRVVRGRLRAGDEIAHCRTEGADVIARPGGLMGYRGLQRVDQQEALPGELVGITGLEAVAVGDTLADPARAEALPLFPVDRPTVSVEIGSNDSPLAGLDGALVSGARIRERLFRELLIHTTIQAEESRVPGRYKVSARGELQIAILIEMMRREGFELTVFRPSVVVRRIDGADVEPVELLEVDCLEPHAAIVTEKVAARHGDLIQMVNHGSGRVAMTFRVSSRGLIGFRSQFLSDTRGSGVLLQQFDRFGPWAGELPGRGTGALVADRPGRATSDAIEHLQPRGAIFVEPGEQVYEGQIIGENAGAEDVRVDVTKERPRVPESTTFARPPSRLAPPRTLGLEQALEFIRDDECIEVTPRSLRMRKRALAGPDSAPKS